MIKQNSYEAVTVSDTKYQVNKNTEENIRIIFLDCAGKENLNCHYYNNLYHM